MLYSCVLGDGPLFSQRWLPTTTHYLRSPPPTTSYDGGPSLSALFGPTKALKDVIDGVLEEVQGRGSRTVGRTVVQDPVRHPGCTASALPVFVIRIH